MIIQISIVQQIISITITVHVESLDLSTTRSTKNPLEDTVLLVWMQLYHHVFGCHIL